MSELRLSIFMIQMPPKWNQTTLIVQHSTYYERVRILKTGAYITGTGSAVPGTGVTNEDLQKLPPTNSKWVEEVLGVTSRRHLVISENLLDLCNTSTKSSLFNSNRKIGEIDAIIDATSTPDYLNTSIAMTNFLNLRTKKVRSIGKYFVWFIFENLTLKLFGVSQ